MRPPIAFLAFAHAVLGGAVVALALVSLKADARAASLHDELRQAEVQGNAALETERTRREQETLSQADVMRQKSAELQYLCEALLAAETREEETARRLEREGIRLGARKRREADESRREDALEATIRACETELERMRKVAAETPAITDPRPGESDEDCYKRLMRAGVALYRTGKKQEGADLVEAALRMKVDDKAVLNVRDELWKTLQDMLMDNSIRRPGHSWGK
ncbi:MAG: hypothetical protein FD180_4988 [Planctomycetota bacterium]|nr:MAG: hypothetical protein FD180_4988 [Planctomycetota bacterium]